MTLACCIMLYIQFNCANLLCSHKASKLEGKLRDLLTPGTQLAEKNSPSAVVLEQVGEIKVSFLRTLNMEFQPTTQHFRYVLTFESISELTELNL
jgi:hypothetical protein